MTLDHSPPLNSRGTGSFGRIPVAEPALVGREEEYVLDCLRGNWISSAGEYVGRFEDAFADFCKVEHAVACANGTVALHVALRALGLGAGDEVICPTLTYVATANAISYCGAKPVFVDSEPNTWTMDPTGLMAAVTSRTKGIVVVHLFGHPADMDPILDFARTRGLFVVEDAAEAHGALYKGRRVGALGDVAIFSFYGNKIITSGEGGMVTMNDSGLASSVRQLKGQGQDPNRRYWFPVIGFNYRMTNIAAAIGLAQLERIDWHLERRREIAKWYTESLAENPSFSLQGQAPWAQSAHWMNSIVLEPAREGRRDEMIASLDELGIETRPVFYPMHVLPPYRDSEASFPVAERLASGGINLPSGAKLTRPHVDFIAETLASIAED
jgi:perosamine synthetase